MYSVVCFYHKHASWPIWRTFELLWLFIWWWPKWNTTFSPRTWYRAKHRSQPFGSELHGRDKSLAWCESLPVYLVYLCHSTKCGPVTYIYCRVFIVGLVAMAVLAIFLVWVQALHHTNSQVTQLIYDWYVGFYGWILCNMITLDVYLKHEMYTSLLLDMPTQMPQPCMGSWWCMYQSNVYTDMLRPIIC